MKYRNLLALCLFVASAFAANDYYYYSYDKCLIHYLENFNCTYADKDSCRYDKASACRVDYENICSKSMNDEDWNKTKKEMDCENYFHSTFCSEYEKVCNEIENYEIDLPDEYLFEYSNYFNCEDQDWCKYLCHKSLRKCWDNLYKYKPNDCWNLENACNNIESGDIPKYQNYTTFSEDLIVIENDTTPNGSKIPKSLTHYLTHFGNPLYQSYAGSSCVTSLNSKYLCNYETYNNMMEVIEVEGSKITRDEYCTKHAEVCHMISRYTYLPNKDLIYNYEQYFGCDSMDFCDTICNTALKLCWGHYPDEDCKKLSIVCESIESGVMPTFDSTKTVEEPVETVTETTKVTETVTIPVEKETETVTIPADKETETAQNVSGDDDNNEEDNTNDDSADENDNDNDNDDEDDDNDNNDDNEDDNDDTDNDDNDTDNDDDDTDNDDDDDDDTDNDDDDDTDNDDDDDDDNDDDDDDDDESDDDESDSDDDSDNERGHHHKHNKNKKNHKKQKNHKSNKKNKKNN